jgi:hypothetical protein
VNALVCLFCLRCVILNGFSIRAPARGIPAGSLWRCRQSKRCVTLTWLLCDNCATNPFS